MVASTDRPMPGGLRCLAALVVILAVSGCSGFGLSDGSSDGDATTGDLTADEVVLAQAPPHYEVGDVYAFDNPDVTWQIVAIDGDGIHWVSDTGEKQTTAANPLLPALAWESARRGSGKRLISDEKGGLFPLKVGNKLTFKSTVSTDKPPYAWEFDWACEVLSREPVDSPAGEFNAFKVMCGRQRPDELVFYYAPKVGHYLRMEVAGDPGEEPLIRSLVGFRRIASTRPATQVIASGGDVPPEEPEAAGSGGNLDWSGNAPATIAPVTSEDTAVSTEAVTDVPQSGMSEPVDLAAASAEAIAPSAPEAATGGYGLHLASYKAESSVDTGWAQLKRQLSGLIDGLSPVVKRVDLGSKGIFYRLHAGPVENQTAAAEMCREIKLRGVYCKVEPL
ncbi:MAG: SPOR domain-containing protein [Alphaproteobacteria bacterium]